MYTYVDDYIPKLKEMYPYMSESDLKRIVNFGWRMFYFYNVSGCDVNLFSRNHKFWMHCGELTEDSMKYFTIYRTKLARKLRVLHKKQKKDWDGYYYTGLTEEEYLNILPKKGSGRKKTKFNFKNKICFKLADEAKLWYNSSKCIIKFKHLVELGYMFKANKLRCTDVSIYLVRDHPDKFADILVENYKYENL